MNNSHHLEEENFSAFLRQLAGFNLRQFRAFLARFAPRKPSTPFSIISLGPCTL